MATDTWERFVDLAIPDPATGRRNQAVAYIPASSAGTGDGIPGLWTFGGYDGSGTNAMTDSSEFFSNPAPGVLLFPNNYEWAGPAGTSVADDFTLGNQTDTEET